MIEWLASEDQRKKSACPKMAARHKNTALSSPARLCLIIPETTLCLLNMSECLHDFTEELNVFWGKCFAGGGGNHLCEVLSMLACFLLATLASKVPSKTKEAKLRFQICCEGNKVFVCLFVYCKTMYAYKFFSNSFQNIHLFLMYDMVQGLGKW